MQAWGPAFGVPSPNKPIRCDCWLTRLTGIGSLQVQQETACQWGKGRPSLREYCWRTTEDSSWHPPWASICIHVHMYMCSHMKNTWIHTNTTYTWEKTACFWERLKWPRWRMHQHLHKDSPITKSKKLYEERNQLLVLVVCAYDSNIWELRKEDVRLRLVWAK